MDFRQDRLAGFTRTEYDGAGNIVSINQVDFTTEPWTERILDPAGNVLEEWHISRPTKDTPSRRLD